jgi:protein pelota
MILRAENLTDLYILSNLIEKGDIASAKTTRRIRRSGTEGREGDKGERITLFLGVNVDELHFQESSVDQRLRIRGKIAFGPEEYVSLNSNHTLNISTKLAVTVQKPNGWNLYHKKLLDDAEKASKRAPIGVVAIERGLATIGLISNFKLNQVAQERFSLPGKKATSKFRDSAEKGFYKRVLSFIKLYFDQNINNVIIGGPGTTKSKFNNYLQDEWPKHNKIIQIENLSSGSSDGLREILSGKTLDRIASEYQIYQEFEILEEFEKRLSTDISKIVYSLEDVYNALEQGAIETLLINDNIIRSKNHEIASRIKKMLDYVEKTRVNLYIVDFKSDNGKKVKNFGGSIGLLRYSLYFD